MKKTNQAKSAENICTASETTNTNLLNKDEIALFAFPELFRELFAIDVFTLGEIDQTLMKLNRNGKLQKNPHRYGFSYNYNGCDFFIGFTFSGGKALFALAINNEYLKSDGFHFSDGWYYVPLLNCTAVSGDKEVLETVRHRFAEKNISLSVEAEKELPAYYSLQSKIETLIEKSGKGNLFAEWFCHFEDAQKIENKLFRKFLFADSVENQQAAFNEWLSNRIEPEVEWRKKLYKYRKNITTKDMYIKAVFINGFKSFAEPLHIEFSYGVNVISDSAGSGNDEIIDAINWVLCDACGCAEQSAESIIFNGNKKHLAADSAEVMLVFGIASNDTDDWHYDITCSRKSERDGTNYYFVNGEKLKSREDYEKADKCFPLRLSYCDKQQGNANSADLISKLKASKQAIVGINDAEKIATLDPERIIEIASDKDGISKVKIAFDLY